MKIFNNVRKCAVCGKEIIYTTASDWTYKHEDKHGRMKWFCRYNHMREWEKKNENNISKRRS